MKKIITEVFTFDELNDKAKDNARAWAREHTTDYEWWESTYEDAKTIGLEITRFDLDRSRHAKGKLLQSAEQVATNILKEHGEVCDTHKLATAFKKDLEDATSDDAKDIVREDFERDLIEEYSVMLQKESEYIVSDEAIDETIEANEYTFTKDGKRFG